LFSLLNTRVAIESILMSHKSSVLHVIIHRRARILPNDLFETHSADRLDLIVQRKAKVKFKLYKNRYYVSNYECILLSSS